MIDYFSFSSLSISRLTSFTFVASRISRFNSRLSITSSVIKTRRSSTVHTRRSFFVRNQLFTNSSLLSNCSSFLHFAFSFNSSRSSIKSQKDEQSSDSMKEQKSNSIEKIQISNSRMNRKFKTREKQKFSRVRRDSFIIDKTRIVLEYMRNLRLSLSNFVQEIVKNANHKQNLLEKKKLMTSLLSNLNDMLNLVN